MKKKKEKKKKSLGFYPLSRLDDDHEARESIII
jgi:hypothetical protein